MISNIYKYISYEIRCKNVGGLYSCFLDENMVPLGLIISSIYFIFHAIAKEFQ